MCKPAISFSIDFAFGHSFILDEPIRDLFDDARGVFYESKSRTKF